MAPAGRLAERFGAHRVLAAGLTIWAVATLATGLVHGFVALLLLRLLLLRRPPESASGLCPEALLAKLGHP